MRTRTGIAMAAMVLVAAGIEAAPAVAAGKVCQNPVSGSGSAKANTPLARSRAEQAWSDAARNAYGQGHGMWVKAESRSMTCVITGRTPKTHTCTATAQPCK